MNERAFPAPELTPVPLPDQATAAERETFGNGLAIMEGIVRRARQIAARIEDADAP